MREPIITDRLRLRPFTFDDLDEVHTMWADPEVGRWVGGTHELLRDSIDELEGHMRHQVRHGYAFWAVEESASGRVVGEVGLQLLEGRGPEVEIGWCLARETWGSGYATEAARAWLAAGFALLGLPRILAVVLPENGASRRVCEKLGMAEKGMREADGAPHVQYVIERSAPRAGA